MPMNDGTALQSSGAISFNQMNIESGGSSGTSFSMSNINARNLVGVKKANNVSISASDFHGAFRDGHAVGARCNQHGVGVKHVANNSSGSNRFSPTSVGGEYNSYNNASQAWYSFGSGASPTETPSSSKTWLGFQSGPVIYVSQAAGGFRRFAAGNGYGGYYGHSGGYVSNTSSVIKYYRALYEDDDGEGDLYWEAAVVAVAPGGYCTYNEYGIRYNYSNYRAINVKVTSDTEDNDSWPTSESDFGFGYGSSSENGISTASENHATLRTV